MRSSIAFALAAANLVAGHATFQSLVVDGKDQGQHVGVQTPSNGNNPILDVSSTAMICNGGTAKTEFVEVAAGSKIGFQWHHNDPQTQSGDQDEPIAASHKGPVMVYVAKAGDGNGQGAVWTKIFEDGLSGGKWAVDTFIANKGLIEITLPDLADGEYLIRPEMIGLHEGNRAKGAQFYNGCGQIKVSGGSTALPAIGVDMTKAYSASDPGVLFDMYAGATSYTIPGPKVWDGASSGTTPATPATPSTPVATPAPSASSAPATPSTPVATPALSVSSAPATPSTPVATPAPSASSAPASPSATPIAEEEPATPTPSAGAGSGSLPETFTITQFISWLKEQSGSSNARRHARAFGL